MGGKRSRYELGWAVTKKLLCIQEETGGGNVQYLLELCVSGVYEDGPEQGDLMRQLATSLDAANP